MKTAGVSRPEPKPKMSVDAFTVSNRVLADENEVFGTLC